MMAEEFLTLMADLDEESQKILSGWYEKLREQGFTGVQTQNLPFHISMGSFSLDKESEVVEEMKKLSDRFPVIPVHISHIGLFEGGRVLYAAPDMNPAGLLDLRQAIQTQTAEKYPWTPHCTIMIDDADTIQKALPILVDNFHTFMARVTKLHLCAFWPTREIATVYLGKYPSVKEAERLLEEAESCNPGPWGDHSRTAAHCAKAIAARSGMNSEKAYVLGLLHDIGRKFGKRHLGHVSDGYSYMKSLGYDDVARICLTHSFNEKDISKYIGKFDTTEEETSLIKDSLDAVEPDDYDRLIQLCDSISGAEGVMDQIDRMTDVKNRYGAYDQGKWDTNIKLREYFEAKMGEDLYIAVDKDNYKP